ncbi:MAG TPA: hypothetical protein VGO18_08335 [Steroidobacteraceae bacterium]|jgi:hypothetical protein|nr:hypothetical protein [Steroidobacteraceae bacterium]
MVISAEPPSEKSVVFARLDTDYSFNLLLPPLLPGASQDDVINKGVNGNLIAEQAATSSPGLDFKGESARSCNSEKCGDGNCPNTASLHCEFEGSGMYMFYQWLKVALGLFIGAAVASTLCLIPVIGWIACLIAEIIIAVAIAASLAALLIGEFGDAAKPSDLDPSLGGEMHQNGCDGKGADLVVVAGTWVYDSLHEGWNEIHPIKRCHKIGTWDGVWPFDPQTTRDRWCAALGAADSPLRTSSSRKINGQYIQWSTDANPRETTTAMGRSSTEPRSVRRRWH